MGEGGARMKKSPPSGSSSVVECNLAKVDVAGSSPVSRSNLIRQSPAQFPCLPTWRSRAVRTSEHAAPDIAENPDNVSGAPSRPACFAGKALGRAQPPPAQRPHPMLWAKLAGKDRRGLEG